MTNLEYMKNGRFHGLFLILLPSCKYFDILLYLWKLTFLKETNSKYKKNNQNIAKFHHRYMLINMIKHLSTFISENDSHPPTIICKILLYSNILF